MPTITTDKLSPVAKAFVAAIIGIVLIMCIAVGAFLHARPSMTIGGPFTLTTGDGKIVTDRSWPGKYLLVYFGYTSCPDVCPTTLADLGIALKTLGPKADKIQPLFITVDPARDTLAVLKAYVAQFSPRLVGLTGTPDQIARVEKDFSVYAQIHRTGTGPDDYQVDHSSIFYLMDRNGKFITVIPADQQGDVLAATIAPFLK